MYKVYALYNRDADRIYIGQSANLKKRLVSHAQKSGKHFTSSFQGKWELIYQESVATRSEALRREKQLKSYQGREFVNTHRTPLPRQGIRHQQ